MCQFTLDTKTRNHAAQMKITPLVRHELRVDAEGSYAAFQACAESCPLTRSNHILHTRFHPDNESTVVSTLLQGGEQACL
jgi:hypothetical protein